MFEITTHQSGELSIDLDALCENLLILQKRVGKKVEITPVVKANAYGLGVKEVVGALRDMGCRKFFVANVQEASHLRHLYKDITILVLNGFDGDYGTTYLEESLIPVLGSVSEIEHYSDFANKGGLTLPAYLHFNTGMNRLGIEPEMAKELVERPSLLNHIHVKCIMSHLACADDLDHPLNAKQLDLFKRIAALYPEIPKSFANSSGIFLGEDYHFNEVRPGMALYGLNPTPYHEINPMNQVINAQLRIVSLRVLHAGSYVGYGATYHTENDRYVATVGAGYADGLFRSLSNKGSLYWQGIRCPIIGRVSMDLVTIDLSDVPDEIRPHIGDFVEFIGPHQSASDIGRAAETIDYEVLTSLSMRYHRTYKYNPVTL